MNADPEQMLPPWRWGPRHWFAVAFFAVLAFVLLRRTPEPATVEPMPTVAKKKPAARKASKPAAKRRAPRQTREEFVAEVKAIAARVDSGEERTYTREEVMRELGL